MLFRNVSDDPRFLPDLGITVAAGDTFEAEGDLAKAYLAQPDLYRRVDTVARQRAAKARRKPDPEPVTEPAPAAADNQE